ncbi:MAG: hypothetical protein MJZ83_04575 [Bacteroidaceae bacterium]|nr:hypothetical protein [Bacteroidaceae bacterium]
MKKKNKTAAKIAAQKNENENVAFTSNKYANRAIYYIVHQVDLTEESSEALHDSLDELGEIFYDYYEGMMDVDDSLGAEMKSVLETFHKFYDCFEDSYDVFGADEDGVLHQILGEFILTEWYGKIYKEVEAEMSNTKND